MPERPDNPCSVLVIDDDRVARADMATVLERAGYVVTTREPRAPDNGYWVHDVAVVALEATYGDEARYSDLVDQLVARFPPNTVIVTSLAVDAGRWHRGCVPIWTLAPTNFFDAVLKALASHAKARQKRKCFVIMPFSDQQGVTDYWTDFFESTIKQAVIETGRYECARSDPAIGPILPDLIQNLLEADVVIADLTGSNANVFYELGLRHAEPGTAILISQDKPVFAVSTEKYSQYTPTYDGLRKLAKQIQRALFHIDDQLTRHSKMATFSNVSKAIDARRKTAVDDCYRDTRLRLEALRKQDRWQELLEAIPTLSPVFAEQSQTQRERALALHQLGRGRDAEDVLKALLARPDHADTLGMLGRVHKDRWRELREGPDRMAAKTELDKAIQAYRRGFAENPGSVYAGVNAATLMAIRDPTDAELQDLYRALGDLLRERVAASSCDYFDLSSSLELALLMKRADAAELSLRVALEAACEPWQLESTARNLELLAASRSPHDDQAACLLKVEAQLRERARQLRVQAR